jgi:alpha-beta hydrolase superfamily lysophospholipase
VAAQYSAEDAADPLFYKGPLRAGTAAALLRAIAAIGTTAASPALRPVPLLVQHGSEDGLCDVSGSEALVAAWGGGGSNQGGDDSHRGGTRDAALSVIPGAHHDLLRERPAVTRAVLEEVVSWVRARV